MGSKEDLSFEGIEKMPLREYTEKAYMDYSMYVILDRALPHIGDGLKPVQRRIVYAMSELGLKATAKYKKSARTVGDVLGKFHPHGDSACYQAMVLMAQPFSYRYPLVDGQGNWGSPDDPKSFAAMRYTESKLSVYSEVLLTELGLGTVDWVQNFDGTMKEPSVLPARLPNLLLNGTTGIAVGMATDIPPHNLKEVANAAIMLLDNPEATTRTLFKYFKGPDYPTKAEIITPREDIINIYEKGTGSMKMRAVYHYENGDIVITALPFQVSGSKIMEQIAAQMHKKKLPMVTDLRDESDHDDPVRFVIVPKSNRIDKDALMAHLFATTDLEQSYRVNMNVIGLNGKPGVRNLVDILREWLEFRIQIVTRRLNHRLEKVLKRLHILDGLLIAYLNIDEVIKIIRSEDKPKPVLMKRFNLTDIQAESILELKLRHLARLEEMKIKGEQDELNVEKDYLEETLGSEENLKALVRSEIKEDSKKYGDKRNSKVVEREEAVAISESEMLPAEQVTVILSRNGWIRSAKGHDIDMSKIKFKAGDDLLTWIHAKSNLEVLFIDSLGKTYSVDAHSLPSARGFGEPLTGRLALTDGSKVVSMVINKKGKHLLIASDAGYGFVVKTSDMMTKNRNGKALITLPEKAEVMNPVTVHDIKTDRVLAITNEGRMLIFPVKDLPRLSKGKGNKIIDIPARRARIRIELLKMLTVIPGDCSIKVHSGQRFFTLKGESITQFEGVRGRRGKKLPRGFQNVRLVEIETDKKAEPEQQKDDL